MRKTLIAGAIGAFFAALAPSAAAAQSSNLYAEVRNWSVYQNNDNCRGIVTYGTGDSMIMSVTLFTDMDTDLTITDRGWRAVEGQNYDTAYHVGGVTFSGAGGTGVRILDQMGYMADMGTGFLDRFAGSEAIQVDLNGVEIANLSLADSGAMVQTLRRCRTELAAGRRRTSGK